MAAIAPPREESTPIDRAELAAWSHPVGGSPPAIPAVDPRAVEEEIRAKNLALAREPEISEDLRLYLEQLADQVTVLPESASVDPYLLLSLQNALIGALLLLDSTDTAGARREMRTRLEQMRQVFRDIAEGGPLYEEASTKELARWLVDVLDTSQASLAELFGISARTFQRWIAEGDSAGPEGEDARRVRVVARVVNHLRHALTGPGVMRWFQLPHPQLDGRRPLDLLDDPEASSRLATLAASARSHTAG